MSQANPEHPETTRGSGSGHRLSKTGHNRKQILFVDHHPLFREGLALLLEWRMGFESIQAGSRTEIRQVLGGLRGVIDLAIVILDSSDGDGASMIASIRRAEPGVPVLALTTNRGVERQTWALEAGADEVLNLAMDVEDIIGAVERLTGA